MYVCRRVADKLQWGSRGKSRERRTPGLTVDDGNHLLFF